MKSIKSSVVLCLFVAILIVSCNKDVTKNIPEYETSTQDNILSFSTSEELCDLLNNSDKHGITEKISASKKFVSLTSMNGGSLKSDDGEISDYYTVLGFDTLVPNKNLASLLNIDGEIMVNNKIYRITPQGTFYFSSDRREYFNSLYYSIDDKINTLDGVSLGNNLYEVAEGIYRFDTFKDDKCIIVEDYDDTEIERSSITRMGVNDPNINAFPSHKFDAHTIVGGWIQGAFGRNTAYTHNFPNSSKRRISVKFYSYNYVFYSETGLNTKTQKKNWIGWSKTPADELRMGWKNVRLQYTPPKVEQNNFPVTTPYIGQQKRGKMLGGGKIFNYVELFGVDITTISNKLFKEGITATINWLNRTYGGSISPNAEAFLIFNKTSYDILFTDDTWVAYNEDSMTHLFGKGDFKIMATVDLFALPARFFEWGKTLQGTLNIASPELVKGSVYGCGRLGTTWQGVRVVKE